jgi:hypothetical protein
MTPDEAQKEIDAVMHDQAHPLHERFIKSDPQAIAHMNKLWEQTAVPESTPPPNAAPVPQPEVKTPGAENWVSPPSAESLSAAEQNEFDAEKSRGFDELRHRWGDHYDANTQDMVAMRDALFDRSADDRAAFELINGALGNNPNFVDLLRSHKAEFLDRLKSSGPIDISGLSPERQQSLLIALAQTAFKNMESTLAKGALQIEDPDGRLRRWMLKTAVRIFGR